MNLDLFTVSLYNEGCKGRYQALMTLGTLRDCHSERFGFNCTSLVYHILVL